MNKRAKSKIFHYNFLKKNRKGILISETMDMVVAIIGIVILVYFAINFIGIFLQNTSSEQAQKSLIKISNEIAYIESGQKTESEFFLESPSDWGITAWPHKEYKESPVKCEGEYCICVCPIKTIQDNLLDKCNEKGVCKTSLRKIQTLTTGGGEYHLFIQKMIFLKIYRQENEIIIQEMEG